MVVALPNRTTSISVVVAAFPGGYQSDRHPSIPTVSPAPLSRRRETAQTRQASDPAFLPVRVSAVNQDGDALRAERVSGCSATRRSPTRRPADERSAWRRSGRARVAVGKMDEFREHADDSAALPAGVAKEWSRSPIGHRWLVRPAVLSRRASVAAATKIAFGATRTPALRERHPAARSGQPDDPRFRRDRTNRKDLVKKTYAQRGARAARVATRINELHVEWAECGPLRPAAKPSARSRDEARVSPGPCLGRQSGGACRHTAADRG